MTQKKWFGVMCICAFISFISYIQTSQYVAEKTGTALWFALGSVFAIGALFGLYKVSKGSGGHQE